MTDRSKIIRHPDVIAAEFERIRRDGYAIIRKMQELLFELGQVADIAYEMMQPEVTTRWTNEPVCNCPPSTAAGLELDCPVHWRDLFTYDNSRERDIRRD